MVPNGGSVSIGSPTTAASLKLGSQTLGASCTSAGAIAYDYTNQGILYCNGSVWQAPQSQFSMKNLQCKTYTAQALWTVQISCPAAYPYALNGGCDVPGC